MKTLNEEQFDALLYAYDKGFIDAQIEGNNFDEVIKYWFGLLEDEDDDE